MNEIAIGAYTLGMITKSQALSVGAKLHSRKYIKNTIRGKARGTIFAFSWDMDTLKSVDRVLAAHRVADLLGISIRTAAYLY